LQREADKVVLCVGATAAPAFEPDASLLKSLELFSFAPSDLLTLTIETASLEQRLRRHQDGGFELAAPQGFRHDGALVSDVLQALGTLRAERWVAARPDGIHGLAEPRLRVKVELGGGDAPTQRELSIGAPSDAGFFASLSPDPGVFVLARSSVLALSAPLVDRRLSPWPASELSRIELAVGARKRVLERRADVWHAANLSNERAAELGETLSALRADFTVHLGPAKPSEGFAKPSLVVTFVNARDQAERLLIGSRATLEGANIVYARRQSVEATFALPAAMLTALQSF
jgi:hypothetical protein